MKYRFAIIGAGWRARYYIRIAEKLPQLFELEMVYCRSSEKAGKLREEHGVRTTLSEDEIISCHPDFIVVAVSKSDCAKVALHFLALGFTVLAETPAGMDNESLDALWGAYQSGRRIVIAEQYSHFPVYSSLIKILRAGHIGEVSHLSISLAHDYHAASLIRAFLSISPDVGFSVHAKSYSFPVTETLTRYEEYHDGRLTQKKRTAAVFEFDDGKVAFYDFDPEQYRSPIRRCHYRILGSKGEISDGRAFLLDEKNRAAEECIRIETAHYDREADNPNFRSIEETVSVAFGGQILYRAPFGNAGLSEDETAIALLMKETAMYGRGTGKSPYELKDALQDAYMSILMRESERTGKTVRSRRMSWM